MGKRKPGISYRKRVADINRIYDQYAPLGIPNREIWLRYVYPVYGVSERTFYNLLKAPVSELPDPQLILPGLFDEHNDSK